MLSRCSSVKIHVNLGILQVGDEWGAKRDIMVLNESLYREIRVHVYYVLIELTFERPQADID